MHTAYGRMRSPLLPAQPALTLMVLLFGVGLALASDVGGPAFLAVVAAAALSVAFASAVRLASTPRPARLRSRSAVGHVDAPTAYWCALAVPVRPQRPRAPGQG